MAAQEDELKSLTDKNAELVQKVQYWKMTAAQKENEKLELMKEINELRLKVIRLTSGGAAEARKLDAALQAACEEALSHLVQASSAVARNMDIAKTYMRNREDLETVSPRWSTISNTNEKVHRVPPMMIGGQSIQPVVSLSRTPFNLNGTRQLSRSPNSSSNVTVRALPMHMLQDVYIPLTRIDMRPAPSPAEPEPPEPDDREESITFDTSMEETPEENMTDDEDYDLSRRLEVVTEDVEPEGEEPTPPRVSVENPLEGPSWLLNARGSGSLEPDSTTEETHAAQQPEHMPEAASCEQARMFTPTVRRRKRSATPPSPPTPPSPSPPPLTPSPPPSTPSPPRHTSINGTDGPRASRVLQVLVPKMSLGESPAPAPAPAPASAPSPPKRRAGPRFDAPSPNGATDSRVIVSEELETETTSREQRSVEPNLNSTNTRRDYGDSLDNGHGSDNLNHRDNLNNGDSGDSDSGSGAERVSEGRSRRNRKPVTYKEKPLNRKLRR